MLSDAPPKIGVGLDFAGYRTAQGQQASQETLVLRQLLNAVNVGNDYLRRLTEALTPKGV